MKYLENHIRNEISNCSREIARLQQKGGSSVENQIIRRRVQNIAQQVEKLTGGNFKDVPILKVAIDKLNSDLNTLSGIKTSDIQQNLEASITGIKDLLNKQLGSVPNSASLDEIRIAVADLTRMITGNEPVTPATASVGVGEGEGQVGPVDRDDLDDADERVKRDNPDDADAKDGTSSQPSFRTASLSTVRPDNAPVGPSQDERDGKDDHPAGNGDVHPVVGGSRKNSTYYKYLKYKMKYMARNRR